MMGTAGPSARTASLIYLQLAVRACVFVHLYIYQPPTDNPLSQLQRSSPEPVCCLGFYRLYILYFFSRACQQRIFKAFPGLREGFAAVAGQAPSTVLPRPGPTRFPSVHPDTADPLAGGMRTDLQNGQ